MYIRQWIFNIKTEFGWLSNIKDHSLTLERKAQPMDLILFLKCMLIRVRTVGPNSILIANLNLNCATTMSQTVYVVYCKYEFAFI